MKKIGFSIPERYVLIQLLPTTGNFETMSTLEALTKILYPSEIEVKKYNIEVKEDMIAWGKNASDLTELEFTEKQIALIINQLDDNSKNDKLDFKQYIIYKKIKGDE